MRNINYKYLIKLRLFYDIEMWRAANISNMNKIQILLSKTVYLMLLFNVSNKIIHNDLYCPTVK